MSPEATSHVRASWALVAPHADAVADDFYRRLFALSPEAAALFAHVDMAHQRRKFMGMLHGLVHVLDDPGMLVSETAPAGRRHAAYGARDEHYPLVGSALVQAIEHQLGPAATPEVRDAWRELYALVSSVMRRASSRAGAAAPA
jgi:hemoglobin-like flavoprotein